MSDEKDDKWVMPTPVFRSSAGSLPKSLEETIAPASLPNSETIEIDVDDDILSIMETPDKDQEAEISEFTGSESILEIESGKVTPAEVAANGNAPTADAEQKPVVLAAKDLVDAAASNTDDTNSNIVMYILVALVLAGIITAVIYYQP